MHHLFWHTGGWYGRSTANLHGLMAKNPMAQAPKERFASEKSAKLMLFCRFLFAQVTCLVLVAVETFWHPWKSMKIHENPWDIVWVPNHKGIIAHHTVRICLFYFWGIIPTLLLWGPWSNICATVKVGLHTHIGECSSQITKMYKDHPYISIYPLLHYERSHCGMDQPSLVKNHGFSRQIFHWGPCRCSDSFDLWTSLCRSPMACGFCWWFQDYFNDSSSE